MSVWLLKKPEVTSEIYSLNATGAHRVKDALHITAHVILFLTTVTVRIKTRGCTCFHSMSSRYVNQNSKNN
uniref:Transposase n=1 Tax=Caenorhabditis tropicalis TaxID=1561998 RepID=A0A1I7UBV4_9PELO